MSGRRLDGAAFERSAADKIELAISGADLDVFEPASTRFASPPASCSASNRGSTGRRAGAWPGSE